MGTQIVRYKAGILTLAITICLLVLAGCGNATEQSSENASHEVPRKGDAIVATDYANSNNWMIASEADLPVDVLVLYPTSYSAGEEGSPVAEIDDAGMRDGAQKFVAEKASAFETSGNLFVPYYRQLDANFTLSQSAEDVEAYIGGVPATDAAAAFDYYFENYNQGRPFILVSHSQGSSVAKELLFHYFKEHDSIRDRMIAAYVIGYSVTQEELEAHPYLKFAERADDTRVIISYNTISPDFEGTLTTLLPGAVSINPISWTRGTQTASAEESLGAYIEGENGYEKVMGLADATVDTSRGVVVCSTADPVQYAIPSSMSSIFGTGSFHGNDISFYYYDLRANAEARVKSYFGLND